MRSVSPSAALQRSGSRPRPTYTATIGSPVRSPAGGTGPASPPSTRCTPSPATAGRAGRWRRARLRSTDPGRSPPSARWRVCRPRRRKDGEGLDGPLRQQVGEGLRQPRADDQPAAARARIRQGEDGEGVETPQPRFQPPESSGGKSAQHADVGEPARRLPPSANTGPLTAVPPVRCPPRAESPPSLPAAAARGGSRPPPRAAARAAGASPPRRCVRGTRRSPRG